MLSTAPHNERRTHFLIFEGSFIGPVVKKEKKIHLCYTKTRFSVHSYIHYSFSTNKLMLPVCQKCLIYLLLRMKKENKKCFARQEPGKCINSKNVHMFLDKINYLKVAVRGSNSVFSKWLQYCICRRMWKNNMY